MQETKKATTWLNLVGASCIATLIAMGAVTPVVAADEGERLLEEIIVQARKRDERLQDVPISMTAFNAAALSDAGIGNVIDMLSVIPSATFEPGDDRVSANITLRGVNRSLRSDEPAFGLYYDGVYIGGQISALPQFLDLEAVEVLRGPQGALYGRNAAAGAIAIRSAQPEAETYGRFSMKFANLDKQEYQGVANFALSDTFFVRAAAMYLNQDGGFNYNPVLDQELDENEIAVGRIRAKWEASDDLELLFTYEKTDRECGACGLASVITDAEAGGTTFAIAALGLGPAAPPDPPIVGLGEDDLRNNKRDIADFMKFEQDLFTTEANYNLDNGTVTAIASYRDVDVKGQRDNDHTVMADKYDKRTITQESFYFELRYSSEFDGPFNFTSGVTYFNEDRSFRTEQLVRVFPGIVGGDYFTGDNAMKRFLVDFVGIPAFIFTGPNAGNTIGGLPLIGALHENGFPLPVVPAGGNWAGESGGSFQADTFNSQKLDSWSGFIEAGYDVSDKLNIWGSLRYTRDDKNIEFDQLVPGCDLICHGFWRNVLGMNQVFNPDGSTDLTTSQIEGHINDDFLFTNWSPGGGITYRHNDNMTFFAKIVTGFKAGGFNENSGVVENLPLDEETSTSYEIGINAKLADGRVALRASGFFHQRRDTVIAIDDPALPPDVNLIGASNADVDTWGAELEIASHPMDGLEVNVAVGYLNTEFVRFSALKAGTLFDFTGNRVPLVYDWTASAQVTYRHDISNALNMFYYALYSAKLDGYLDEANLMEADDIQRLNLKLGVESEDWSVVGYVDNVFDTVDIAYQNPRNQFRTFTYGRTYGVQLIKEF